MSSKSAAVDLTAIITASRDAKAATKKVETYQDGTTIVQALVTAKEVPGCKVAHAIFTPTRRWPSAPEGSVLVYKNLSSAIAARAQWEAAHPQVEPDGFFEDLGVVAEAKETPEATLGFGLFDRAFEVALTPKVVEMLANAASFSGSEHVASFKEKARIEKIKSRLYRAAGDEVEEALKVLEANSR